MVELKEKDWDYVYQKTCEFKIEFKELLYKYIGDKPITSHRDDELVSYLYGAINSIINSIEYKIIE